MADFQGKVTLGSAGTATIWAAASGFRWKIRRGVIGFTGASPSCVIALLDDSATAFVFSPLGTGGLYPFDFGDDGFYATATNSSLRLQQTGTGTTYAWFTGTSK